MKRFCILVTLFLLAACQKQEILPSKVVSVTKVVLSQTKAEMNVGEDLTLKASVQPEDATDKDIQWQSSDYDVANVDGAGQVSAMAPGTAKITASCGGKKAVCNITVKDPSGQDPDPDPDPDPNPDPVVDPENDDPTGTKGVGEFPSVWIELGASGVDRYNYTETVITFKDPASWYTSVEEMSLKTNIRGRGNMSWSSFDKRPYRLKFTEEAGAHRVFGMNRNRDWDLIANANDHILLRNSIGYHISRQMGFDWTPKVRAVELYMNGKYRGNYILVQHKEVASEKVNIEPATPQTAPEQGGYYLEVEDKDGNGDYTSSVYKMPFWWNDPETPTQAQKEYLIGIIENIDAGLRDKDFDKVWANLEMGPMVDYYILKELSKDIDGCLRKSNYFSKAPGTKLRMCHVWDFDLAFGNCSDLYYDGHYYYGSATGWFIKEVGGNYYLSGNYYGKGKGWYPAMFQDPVFVAAVKARWTEVYPMLQTIPEWVDKQVGYYQAGFDHNFEKWDIRQNVINRTIEGSYEGEIRAFKEWYNARLEWMNSEISQW